LIRCHQSQLIAEPRRIRPAGPLLGETSHLIPGPCRILADRGRVLHRIRRRRRRRRPPRRHSPDLFPGIPAPSRIGRDNTVPGEQEKRELLDHERFIADVESIRRGPEAKRWWTGSNVMPQLFAILTVAVTTFASYCVQTRLKSRDSALARQDLRLTQTRDAMVAVYELLNTLLKGTEDRVKIATGQYAELSDTMVNQIIDETNTSDSLWRRKRETVEAGVYLYFGDNRSTIETWKDARTRMQTYADCAEQAFMTARRQRIAKNSCENERGAADRAFAQLRDALIGDYSAKLAS
jgi:hypothetical protein